MRLSINPSHVRLIYQFTRREIEQRYRGAFLGLAWSLITPILMLAVYTLVFHHIFKARWSLSISGGPLEFAIQLYAGLLIHAFFCECLSRAPGIIVSSPNLVKKVVFPLDILAWVTLWAAVFGLLLNALVWLVAIVIWGNGLCWTMLWLPVIWTPLVIFSLGVIWFLSALGVYIRDIGQVTGLLTSLLMFLSPIFYPAKALPDFVQPWLFLNPLALVIEQTRAVALLGESPEFFALAIYALAAIIFACLARTWFMLTRRGFADVL